jgi:hypothetical protein
MLKYKVFKMLLCGEFMKIFTLQGLQYAQYASVSIKAVVFLVRITLVPAMSGSNVPLNL